MTFTRRLRWQAQADPQGAVLDRDGSGCTVEGYGCPDGALLPQGGWRSFAVLPLLMVMLRVHLMQNWFGYNDLAIKEVLYATYLSAPACRVGPEAHSGRSNHSQLSSPAGETSGGCWHPDGDRWLLGRPGPVATPKVPLSMLR